MESATTMDGVRGAGRYDPIGFGGAFSRQLRLLWMSRRPLLMFVGLVGVLVLAGPPWNDDPVLTRFLVPVPVWLVLAGPVWAFTVFHNEGPSRRLYHWSQPVARDGHAMARVAAGLAWLWILYAALVVVGILFGLMDGRAGQLAAVGFAGWVNYLSAPTIGFLGVSLLTIPSDYPLRWFFGLILLFALAMTLLVEWLTFDQEVVRWILQPLANESWGLGITLVAALGRARELIERAAEGEAVSGGAAGVEGGDLPAVGWEWWAATAGWILALGVAVWLLARRHPDVFPRWYRSR